MSTVDAVFSKGIVCLGLCLSAMAVAPVPSHAAEAQQVQKNGQTHTVTAGEESSESSGQTGSDTVGSSQKKSASEIAHDLANPNSVLGNLQFNLDYVTYKGDIPGANDQDAWTLSFQPVLPYPLAPGVNFFLRPLIPMVIKQDVPNTNSPDPAAFDTKRFELGDIGFDAAIGKNFKSGLVLVGGITGKIPTATSEPLGGHQWLLGPELLVGQVTKKGFVGVLVSHLWDVEGRDYDTSITAGQYFYTIGLKDGWQIQSAPTYSYNHNAAKGSRWTLPLGFGVKKTLVVGGRPFKVGVEYWHYAKQAEEFGPDWQLRFSFTPVVALPWGKK